MNDYFINELKEQEEDSDSIGRTSLPLSIDYDDESMGYDIETYDP